MESEPDETFDLFVVSNSEGFVGAYDKKELLSELLEQYPEHDFVFQLFALERKHGTESVLVIPYIDNNAVAFVSNNIEDVRRFQEDFTKVGLVCDDDPEHWRAEINAISIPAKNYLENVYFRNKGGKSAQVVGLEELIEKFGIPEKKLFERVKMGTKEINILKYVEPVVVHPAE